MLGTSIVTLEELPSPPAGLTGWPWTEGTRGGPSGTERDEYPWITIVTPSYNQGEFIEETIRSILLQAYPNLQYIVMDGGSRDGTCEVLKKYDRWIQYWSSEPDQGQAHAINKGWRKATGDIFQWINSDDILAPDCLHKDERAMPPGGCIAGSIRMFGDVKERIDRSRNLDIDGISTGPSAMTFRQPGLWLSTASAAWCFPLNEEFHYAFDWEMLLRLVDRSPRIAYIDDVLVNFRMHPKSKTVSKDDQWLGEGIDIARRLLESKQIVAGRPQLDGLLCEMVYIREMVDAIESPSVPMNVKGVKMLLRRPSVAYRRHALAALKRKIHR